MRGLAYLLGIASGFGLTLQVGMNSQLRTVLQSANTRRARQFPGRHARAHRAARRHPRAVPARDTLASVPVWAWFGGFLGAFYVAVSTVVASQLGAASLLGLALLGQLAMAWSSITSAGWGCPCIRSPLLASRAWPCWARASGSITR